MGDGRASKGHNKLPGSSAAQARTKYEKQQPGKLCVMKINEMKILQSRPRLLPGLKLLPTQMMTRDLFVFF